MSKRPPSAEDDFVARLIRPLAGEGAFDLKDDAARLVPPRGHELILKTDAVVMGVHAFPEDPPDLIARKALRMNLSDLAGKGATPLGFLLSLALPPDTDQVWLGRFFEGLAKDCAMLLLSVARRRHHAHARPVQRLDHDRRRGAARPHADAP